MNLDYQRAHWLNAHILPPVGLGLNAAFIWLLLRKTPKEMATHSRILLQTCVLDILFLAVLTIGEPIFTFIDGKIIIIYEGYFSRFLEMLLARIYPILHYLIYIFLAYFQIFSICVQFLYRYFILNKNYHINWRHYILLLLLPFSIVLSLFSLLFRAYNNNPMFISAPLLMDGCTYPAYILIDLSWGLECQYIYILMLLFNVSIFTVIVIFCAVQMIRFVNSHVQFNERMKRLNRQLTLTLILLAKFPFIQLAFECITTIWPITDLMFFNFMANLMETWPPILNPIIGILTNKPYRETIFGFLKKMTGKCAPKAVQVLPA